VPSTPPGPPPRLDRACGRAGDRSRVPVSDVGPGGQSRDFPGDDARRLDALALCVRGFTGYFGAPFCDDRGATGLAARPDLQAPDAILQQARSGGCDLGDDAWRVMLRPGGAKIVATAESSAPVHTTPAVTTRPVESFDLVVNEVAGHPSPGERTRVERPPRA